MPYKLNLSCCDCSDELPFWIFFVTCLISFAYQIANLTINSIVVAGDHLPCDSAILPYSWGSLTNVILIYAQCYFFLRGIGTEWKFNDISKNDECGSCSEKSCGVISWLIILAISVVLAVFGTKGLVENCGCITTKLLVLCIISLIFQYSSSLIALIALVFRSGLIEYKEETEVTPTDVRIQPSGFSLPYKIPHSSNV